MLTAGTNTQALNHFVATWLGWFIPPVAHVELIPKLTYKLCYRLAHYAFLLAQDASAIFQLLTLSEGQAFFDKKVYITRPRLLEQLLCEDAAIDLALFTLSDDRSHDIYIFLRQLLIEYVFV